MAGAVVLVLILIFILQNTRSVKVSYFTFTGSMPLGTALLLATIAGLLLAGGIASCESGSCATGWPGKTSPLVWSLRRLHRAPEGDGRPQGIAHNLGVAAFVAPHEAC